MTAPRHRSLIVPVPSASLIVAPEALLKCTVNVSLVSYFVSPFTITVICIVVSVGPKVSVPVLDW